MDPAAGGCLRWPEHYRLKSSLGEVVRGRCKATNLCAYCARLMAVETSELLMLDAMEDAPSLYVVLTARELLDRKGTYFHLQQVRRAVQRRWPLFRYAVLVEFQRRGALHLNLLVKGVPAEARAELHEVVSRIWCERVDAEPQAQFVGEVSDGGGLVRYISLHFLKPGQAPPVGWKGQRISYTRDYLVRPASVLRAEAKRSLKLKRELWRARQSGLEGAAANEAAELAVLAGEALAWELWQLPGTGSEAPTPRSWSPGQNRRRFREAVTLDRLVGEFVCLFEGSEDPP